MESYMWSEESPGIDSMGALRVMFDLLSFVCAVEDD